MKMLTAAALVAAMALAGCAKEPEPAPPENTGNTGGTATGGPAPESAAYFNQVVGDRVFFATDQYNLDAEDRATLDRQAQWLNTYSGVNVTVEGHADERGTRQYNLALGARRANAVRQYLIQAGVAPNRVRAVTFGKERPEALCSDESCWSQNRRGVSVVAGAPGS